MEKTVENNILLAEFLGWETDEVEVIAPKSLEVIVPFETVKGFFTTSIFKHEELKFHNDWNWLMLVVDKIESLGFSVTIHTDTCYVAHNTDKSIETIINISDYKIGKLKVVYNACVQFVKWFNKQSLKQ